MRSAIWDVGYNRVVTGYWMLKVSRLTRFPVLFFVMYAFSSLLLGNLGILDILISDSCILHLVNTYEETQWKIIFF